MLRQLLKVMAATAAFGLVHSALASRKAKRYAAGSPAGNSTGSSGRWAGLLHAGQAAALLQAISAARQVGIERILGLESLRCWLGNGPVPPTPEAQGPALDAEGQTHAAGPFAWSRHPLNFAPLPVFWLWPKMTTSLLAFNIAATAYLIVGSLHEESRLREAYGEAYLVYQRSGVPFYLPSPEQSALEPMEAVAHRPAEQYLLEGARP
jgi:hypothetical protein